MHRVNLTAAAGLLVNFIAKPCGAITTKFYVFKARVSAGKI